jgi:hypothetical protein
MARRDPLLEQALLASSLKLAPQENALRSLLTDLAGQYTRGRRVNASNAAGIKAATQQARPDVGSAFEQALASTQAQRAALGVGPADPQAQAFERRVGEERAHALNDLTDREVRAEEGRVYANQTARDEYLAGKQKITDQLAELAAQGGAETQSTYNTLKDKQRDRSIRRGVASETKRHNQEMEGVAQQNADTAAQRASDAKKAKGKLKLASQEQHAKARDSISQAMALVERQRSLGTKSRAELIRLLTTGRPKQKVKSSDGTDVDIPAIPQLPADYVRAAVNMVFDGSLSRGDLKRLHDRRLRVNSLGFPVRRPGQRPQSTGTAAMTGGVVGAVG